MLRLGERLALPRCPHCDVTDPVLDRAWTTETADQLERHRHWMVFRCVTCASLIVAGSDHGPAGVVTEMYPELSEPPPELPRLVRQSFREAFRRRANVQQSMELLGRAIQEMVTAVGYTQGSVFDQLGAAVNDERVPAEMVEWAQELQLDQISPRYHVSKTDFEHRLDFAVTLGDYLFVLPKRIARCRARVADPTAEFPIDVSPTRASWRDYSPRTGEYPTF